MSERIIALLKENPLVADYRLNTVKTESYEMFFVHRDLETVRSTDTATRKVTVFVQKDGKLGDATFSVYASYTDEDIRREIAAACKKASLAGNEPYNLPANETLMRESDSNFKEYDTADLAAAIADAVFAADCEEGGSINALEVFLYRDTVSVKNSRGIDKTEIRYHAMVEAIPTYNGENMSVELYEQYNFSSLDLNDLRGEIAGKMAEVRARFEAVKPDAPLEGNVILNKLELEDLFFNIARSLNYASVYSHSNLWNKGDAIQKAPQGDVIGITMAGQAPGSVRSSQFDSDGLALNSIRIVEGGKAAAYYGSNRYGQYLGEVPTGDLRCLCADPGTASAEAFTSGKYLEVISMSGLQVDFYNDYIGGEVRLAYYHDGEKTVPVTGVSISGKLSQVLDKIRFSSELAVQGGYFGPAKAALQDMTIF